MKKYGDFQLSSTTGLVQFKQPQTVLHILEIGSYAALSLVYLQLLTSFHLCLCLFCLDDDEGNRLNYPRQVPTDKKFLYLALKSFEKTALKSG